MTPSAAAAALTPKQRKHIARMSSCEGRGYRLRQMTIDLRKMGLVTDSGMALTPLGARVRDELQSRSPSWDLRQPTYAEIVQKAIRGLQSDLAAKRLHK